MTKFKQVSFDQKLKDLTNILRKNFQVTLNY